MISFLEDEWARGVKLTPAFATSGRFEDDVVGQVSPPKAHPSLGWYSIGPLDRAISPRLHMPDFGVADGDKSFTSMDLFPSRLSFMRMENDTLRQEAMLTARRMAKYLKKKEGRYDNNHFFSWQMEHQSALISKYPSFARITQLAKEACTKHVLQSLPSEVHDEWRKYLMDRDTQIWATLLEKNNHGKHVHENAICSGVMYVNVPENSSPIIFSDPRGSRSHYDEEYGSWYEEPRAPHAGVNYFFPHTGDIVCFPSFITHEVPPGMLPGMQKQVAGTKAKFRERITYAFNMNSHDAMSAFGIASSLRHKWDS